MDADYLTNETTPVLLSVAEMARQTLETGEPTCHSVLGEMPNTIFYAVGGALVKKGYSPVDASILSLGEEIRIANPRWKHVKNLHVSQAPMIFYAAVDAVTGHLELDKHVVKAERRNWRRYRRLFLRKWGLVIQLPRRFGSREIRIW